MNLIVIKKWMYLEKGLSLIEASMVLALAAIVVSGALYYFNTAKDSERRMENMRTLNNITGVVNKLYLSYGSNKAYDGLSNTLIAKALQGIKLRNDGRIQLADDIKLTIESTTNEVNGVQKYFYAYLLEDIPSEQCQEYVTLLAGIPGVQATWLGLYDSWVVTWSSRVANNLANLWATCAKIDVKTQPQSDMKIMLIS